MSYDFKPTYHIGYSPDGYLVGAGRRRTPRSTWGTNDQGHITGEIASADYYLLINAGRHGDKAAIAELKRRDALGQR